MNYGQAIEAMKRGGTVGRWAKANRAVRLAHLGTTLQYFEAVTDGLRQPYVPTTEDQLADDWLSVGGVYSVDISFVEAA